MVRVAVHYERGEIARLMRRWLRRALHWTLLVPRLLGWLVVLVAYRIRPFDMLADRRRWFWQPRQRCGFGPLPPAERAAFMRAVEQMVLHTELHDAREAYVARRIDERLNRTTEA